MCDPSQFRATYSTNAEVSSLYHSTGRMVLEEVLLLENKLLQASLLSTFFPLVRFSLFSRLSCLEYSQYCQNAFFCSLLLRLSQKLTIISQICYSFYDTERLCYRLHASKQTQHTISQMRNRSLQTQFLEKWREGCDVLND